MKREEKDEKKRRKEEEAMKEQQETSLYVWLSVSVWYVRYVYMYRHDQYRTVPYLTQSQR